MEARTGEEASRHYTLIALSLLVGAVAYIAYMCRLFSRPEPVAYGKIPSIAIATIAFTELGLALRGLLAARRKGDLLAEGLTFINLSSASPR